MYVFGDHGDRLENWSKEKFMNRIFYVGQGLPHRCFEHYNLNSKVKGNSACPTGIRKAFSKNMGIKMIKIIVTNNAIVSDLIEGGLLFTLKKCPQLENKEFYLTGGLENFLKQHIPLEQRKKIFDDILDLAFLNCQKAKGCFVTEISY